MSNEEIVKSTEGYSRDEAKYVSGIAILMMFFHHFFAYPKFWPFERCFVSLFYYKGLPVEQIIAPFGQLCVGIFAFNSGYVLYKNSGKFSDYISVLPRLFKFLSSYWIVCVLFIIYGIFSYRQLPDTLTFLENLFGVNVNADANYINVAHGWYVAYYSLLLLLSPLIIYVSRLKTMIRGGI